MSVCVSVCLSVSVSLPDSLKLSVSVFPDPGTKHTPAARCLTPSLSLSISPSQPLSFTVSRSGCLCPFDRYLNESLDLALCLSSSWRNPPATPLQSPTNAQKNWLRSNSRKNHTTCSCATSQKLPSSAAASFREKSVAPRWPCAILCSAVGSSVSYVATLRFCSPTGKHPSAPRH